MSKLKWMMKQYWRIGTVRALLSLGMGMFVLGKLYYRYVPVLQDMGLLGALVLGTVLFFFFLGVGWAYDVKAKMWSPKTQVGIERNPYRYVPNFKDLAASYPFFNATLRVLEGVFEKLGLDRTWIRDLRVYLARFYSLRPNRRDLQLSERLAAEFMATHPFSRERLPKRPVGLGARMKLWFELNILRIGWVQSLTGMTQDVLVLAAFYVVFLFPDQVENNAVPIHYLLLGIVLVAVPVMLFVVALGWYYDRKLKAWSADLTVKVERNPYSYVPQPRLYMTVFPYYSAVLTTLRDVFAALDMDTSCLDRAIEFLKEYCTLSVTRDEDMQRARELRKTFGATFVAPQKRQGGVR